MSRNEAQQVRRVLIIDDNPEDRITYRRLLAQESSERYLCLEAETGDEGLAIARSESPDAILVDLNLPDVDGLDLLQQFSEEQALQDIAIVMMTGHGSETVAVDALERGAHEYLPKGKVTSSSLRRVLDNAIQKVALNRALRRSREELEIFASTAAHDLKAPLRHISSLALLLAGSCKERLNEEELELVALIESSAQQMNRLIDDLIVYAQDPFDDQEGEAVDLKEISDRVLLNLQGSIADTDANITVGEFPVVEGHYTGLIQLLQNLIANALKFRGETPPRIEISTRLTGDLWTISVSDNGIGIDPAHQDQVFAPFKRLHGTAQFEGSGLGLATCRKVVDRHGGEIWIDSAGQGCGSTVRFTLPVMSEVTTLNWPASLIDTPDHSI